MWSRYVAVRRNFEEPRCKMVRQWHSQGPPSHNPLVCGSAGISHQWFPCGLSAAPTTTAALCSLLLATVPNRRVGSGSGSGLEPNRCNGSYHTKTRTVAIGPVLQPKTRQNKSTIFAPIKYLSSDRIVTWSVGKSCKFSPAFTARYHIRSRTNFRPVVIKNPWILPEKWGYFTAIRWILVQSQIWQREVKERLKLHNLHTDHIVIQSELKYFIWVKVAGTVMCNRGPGSTRPKNRGFMSGPGNQPAKTERVGLLGGSWPGPGPSGRFQPGPKRGIPEPLLTLLLTHPVPGSSLTIRDAFHGQSLQPWTNSHSQEEGLENVVTGSVVNCPVRRSGTVVPSELLPGRTGRRESVSPVQVYKCRSDDRQWPGGIESLSPGDIHRPRASLGGYSYI